MSNRTIRLALVAGVFSALPAAASAQTNPPVYWESDNWRVVAKDSDSERYGWCELASKNQKQGILRFFRGGAEVGYLQFRRTGNVQSKRGQSNVRWTFDGKEFRGSEFARGLFSPSMSDEDKVRNFKKAGRLVIMKNDQAVADFSLVGSFHAHRKLSECAARWPESSVPVSPPPPPVPRRSRKAIPLNPAQWITVNDYKIGWAKAGHQGSVSFILSVDADGSVDNCAISGGSAPAVLKTETCRRLIERARFKPAKSAYGQQIADGYSGTVRWSLPSPSELE